METNEKVSLLTRIKRNVTLGKVLTYVFLAIGALVMVWPFYWMISSAFKTQLEIVSFPPAFVPNSWAYLENFKIAFVKAPFAKYFFNSIVVTIACVACTTFTTILASFAFSRLNFKGRDLIFSLLLSFMMVPFEMVAMTNTTTITQFGLNNSLLGLIVPFTTSIYYTFILRNFFVSIPDSLYYSARIDGASNWQYLWKIMVPIAKPSLFTIILLNALTCWNSFFWPRIIITSAENRTLPFGLYAFMSEGGTEYGPYMAAATIVVVPMIALFLVARKYIVNGVARGGLKG
ncbi:MAG: carbohydrate ABC transporter permease [Erysipelotrichales bacterium]|nr:carbohydrate ABC transporter permease [Erysipelotrichales bacterium]